MKQRDYAKRYYVNKTKSRKPKIGFIIIVLFLILGAGVGIYLKSRPASFEQSTGSAFFSHLKTVFAKKQSGTAVNAKKQKSAEEEPSVHFSFYSALPNMRVEISSAQPVAASSGAAPAPVAATRIGYILQFGVFKEYSKASDLRLSLLLSGIETEIEKIGKNQEISYRIQQGPFATLTQAKSLQQKWQKKGIETSLKKI